jgi:hypothetical protein
VPASRVADGLTVHSTENIHRKEHRDRKDQLLNALLLNIQDVEDVLFFYVQPFFFVLFVFFAVKNFSDIYFNPVNGSQAVLFVGC